MSHESRNVEKLEELFQCYKDTLDEALEGGDIPEIPPQHRYRWLTSSAMEMSLWATEGVAFNDLCNRASLFGNFVAHYDNHDEAKVAVENYMEKICGDENMPRYVRRDIISCATCCFSAPCIDDVYNAIAEQYGDDDEIFQKAEIYLAASAEERAKTDNLAPGILKIIKHYEQESQNYELNVDYLQELHKLATSIECDKYGI